MSVKLSAEPDAVKVAQVPEVYQVPLDMMQPFLLPLVRTLRVPRPLKGVPGVEVEVGDEPGEVPVLGSVVSECLHDPPWL